MTEVASPPRATQPFFDFATVLRQNGFPVAPDQTGTFVEAVGLLGPKSIQDIHRAGLATLAPPPERRAEFDALFRAVFLGQSIAAPARSGDDDDDLEAFDDRDGAMPPPEPEELTESGAEATPTERLGSRAFGESAMAAALTRIRRRAVTDLPKRIIRRRSRARRGDRPDIRRALRTASRRDGEVLTLPWLRRRLGQRRLLLLVDVSGSMKDQTDAAMRVAHALTRAADQCETFTLGTRLTRVTRALRLRNPARALDAASGLVADWDGGTRLGDALEAFLAVPRFSGLARGALVVIVSDGLERGEPDALIAAMTRLSRMAWSILWVSPIVGETGPAPQTEAMRAVLPFIDRLGDGRDGAALADEILTFGRTAR